MAGLDLTNVSDADLMAAIKAGAGSAAPDPSSAPAPGLANSVQYAAPQPVPIAAASAPSAGPKSPQNMSDAELMSAIKQGQGASGGILRNVGAGADQALYSTLGAPVDAASWLLNKGVEGVNAIAGTNIPESRNPLGGSESIANAFGAAGVPDPSSIAANTTGEKIARGVGSGIGYAVAPEAAAAGLMRAGAVAPGIAEAVGNAVGRADSLGGVAGNAIAGGAAGGGATIAEQAAPDKLKPIAGLAGGMVGGLLGAGATAVPRALGQAGGLVRDYAAPLTAGGQERLAGQALQDAATSPSAVRQVLDNPPAPLVDGSNPTTFQLTGDMGLGGLERAAAVKAPEQFNQLRADQNSARLAALANIQDVGHPEAVASTLRSRLADLDAQTDAAVQSAAATAAQRASALGGTGTPEAYGATLRDALSGAETSARQSERGLWDAVDPNGTLTLPSASVARRAKSITTNLPATAAPMAGEEGAIFDVASSLPPVIPFVDASALRARISQAMRQEMMTAGQSPSYARLTQLRGALQDDIDGVVAQRAKQDAQAVAAGAMAPADTIVARYRQWTEDERAAQQGTSLASSGTGAGAGIGSGSRSAGVGGPFRDPSEAGGRFGGPAGYPGMAPGDGASSLGSFDDAARQRLIAATDATRDRAQTFGATPNAAILKRSGQGGPYNMTTPAVPGSIFFPGPKAAATVENFRNAVGEGPAFDTLADYASSQLRRATTQPDGTLNPNTVASWRAAHADALRSFPALDASFADAGQASQTMAATAEARREALDAYQTGIVGRVLGVSDPSDVTRTVGSIFGRKDSVLQMQRLAAEAGQTPEGKDGLRKAIVDYMTGRLVSNTEAATTGRGTLKADQFQTFVKQNQPALKAVFSDNELGTMQAVADDLQRANRSIAAVKLPGGSNTAQDTFAVGKSDTPASALMKIVLASGGAAGIGAIFGGPIGGAAAAIGTGTVQALRQAGLHKVDDLVRDAMLDPATARILLAKAPAKGDSGPYIALAQRYRRAALAGAGAAEQQQAPTAPPPSPARRGIFDQLTAGAR